MKLFNSRTKKKGSLNLSINAIVIVVLAMTLLGLGLGFIKNMFGDITETTGTVQEQVKEQILDDLRRGNKRLSFPTTSLSIEKGDYKDIAIGIKNIKSTDTLDFTINFTIVKMSEGLVDEDKLSEQVDFFYEEGPFTLKVTNAEVYPIRINAEGTKGTYLAKITINEEESTYAEKTFFINII